MENTDITPSQTEQELELETSTETTEETQGGDYLDAIEDKEMLRAEAKKFRAIGSRKSKTPPKEVEKPSDSQPVSGEFLTRSDYAKIATREARKKVDADIAEVWDELVAIPLAGYDPLDSDSIAKNMRARYAVYKAEQPSKETKPDTSELTTTKAVGTGQAKPRTVKKDPPGFNLPKGASDWY